MVNVAGTLIQVQERELCLLDRLLDVGDPKMADDACFVFFDSTRCSLADAAKALADCGLVVNRTANELEAGFPGKPVLRITLVTGDYVREEAKEIAAHTPHAPAME